MKRTNGVVIILSVILGLVLLTGSFILGAAYGYDLKVQEDLGEVQ